MKKRRRAAVLVAGLAWSMASMAAAQTSTSTSTTTTSTTSTTSTSSTTSTTVANPCAGQPCTAEPPDAFLAGAAGEVRLDRGSWCWRSPAPNAEGLFTAICADAAPRDPDAILAVTPGETLTLRFGTSMAPTYAQLERGDAVQVFTPGNPITFSAQYSAGSTPILRFFTRWLQGDMSYSVRLDLRTPAGPASPRPGPLSLTG